MNLSINYISAQRGVEMISTDADGNEKSYIASPK